MKNRALVCLFVTGIFIAACIPPPGTPATATVPAQAVVPPTTAPVTATPTTTTIPLPISPGVEVTAAFTIQVPLAGVGSLLPLASPNSGTLNCRTGPDIFWAVTAIVDPGESVEIAGKNPDATWWYVKHPEAPAGFCWVSAVFVDVNGNVSAVPIVAVDPSAPTSGDFTGSIISVNMFIEPNTIDIPGCFGPAPPMTVVAKIQTNGPLKMKLHFEHEQLGDLGIHKMEFFRPDIQDLTDTFITKDIAGTFVVYLFVEDIVGEVGAASYTVTCS